MRCIFPITNRLRNTKISPVISNWEKMNFQRGECFQIPTPCILYQDYQMRRKRNYPHLIRKKKCWVNNSKNAVWSPEVEVGVTGRCQESI